MIPEYTEPNFDNKNALGYQFKVVPEKEVQKLIVTWPLLMSFDKHWQSKVNYYISNVIGHEGPKSLLSELISQGLATTLMATDITRCRGQFGELTVSISLTNKGVENYKDVLVLLFSYLDKIKKEGV